MDLIHKILQTQYPYQSFRVICVTQSLGQTQVTGVHTEATFLQVPPLLYAPDLFLGWGFSTLALVTFRDG